MAKITHDDVKFPIGHSISPLCLDIIQRLLNKDEAQRLGAEESLEVQRHGWFDSIDFDALYRKELRPVYIPAAVLDDPLALFPDKMTEQVVDKSDFQAPAKSGLARTLSRDEFAVSALRILAACYCVAFGLNSSPCVVLLWRARPSIFGAHATLRQRSLLGRASPVSRSRKCLICPWRPPLLCHWSGRCSWSSCLRRSRAT